MELFHPAVVYPVYTQAALFDNRDHSREWKAKGRTAPSKANPDEVLISQLELNA
ncbi:hypothetical protein G6M86_29125 (plasmid) [Agrobacterium tumefaciens]|uniref:Uncharacterized protein n=1 Tax=Agrobacterium tumefaciens TaxID=358 RepID=A0AAJ4N8Z2_AGRTU|nr:hypothetical protein G6M86_29125 [Agrobacterium tumefaciens]